MITYIITLFFTLKEKKKQKKKPITFVLKSGYDLLTFRKPPNIFGNSEGFTGSTAIFITEFVLNLRGLNIYSSDDSFTPTIVAVLTMG